RGGLVTFCWHWRDPGLETIAFYTDQTDFRPIMNDPEVREQLIRDIDLIAGDLKQLEEAGVPVLWRPLHEAAGGWFWWGASGPENFMELWKLLVDRLDGYHGLTNLIWVYNGQHPDWYPGDEWVDIIGEDPYVHPQITESDTLRYMGSHRERFLEAARTPDQPKMVAMTENGTKPHPDSMHVDQTVWLWFKTWNDGLETEGQNAFLSGEVWNPHDYTRFVYHHPRVLTLEDVRRELHGKVD
ncbi:glycosyl hydrolase, partial [Balneolaceae bacterium ANBcel3]|nr:glycosyl hydrolase [Balneolaceae bacterium ANBcel3]